MKIKTDDYDYFYYQNNQQQNDIDLAKLEKEKNRAKLKEISQEIILQEILDKIHCFLCHNISNHDILKTLNYDIDIGQCLDDEIQEIVYKVINKIHEWQRINNIRPRNDMLFNKFSTDLTINNEHKNDEDHNRVIHIGSNFDYKYMNAKYNNLKNEILSKEDNKHYHLDIYAWNDIYDLSLVIKQSYKTRKMSQISNQDESVSIEFIICLIIYCNYIQIRNDFLSTYYDDDSKHSAFANMAQILKHNIDKFGNEWNWSQNNKPNQYLYHCVTPFETDSICI